MLEIALTSFTTFFATIGPVEAAVLFATLTPKMSGSDRAAIAVRATIIASLLLLIFTLLGQPLLDELGVSIAALQTAGGIILLLIALDMIFAKPTSAFKLTQPEDEEAQTKDDIAVFPLAMPLLAGPGAMSAGILLAANADGNAWSLAMVVGALAAVMADHARAATAVASAQPRHRHHRAAGADARVRHPVVRHRRAGGVRWDRRQRSAAYHQLNNDRVRAVRRLGRH